MTLSPFTIQVRLFARYAEVLGADRVEVTLPGNGTVADAIGAVRALPGGAVLPTRLLVARGLEQVTAGERLSPGDELAFLPPMSGG
jgi:molybdopterin converting factor small subunit